MYNKTSNTHIKFKCKVGFMRSDTSLIKNSDAKRCNYSIRCIDNGA